MGRGGASASKEVVAGVPTNPDFSEWNKVAVVVELKYTFGKVVGARSPSLQLAPTLPARDSAAWRAPR
eukprot:scaffold1134_cov295-Prasinococcus_capsulatus_cf.AAC.3